MNLKSRHGSRVIIRQIPFVLLFVAALFSLPLIAFSLFCIVTGTEADGIVFSLIFGLVMLWVFLEFVATREKITIDLDEKRLTREVNGVFRHKRQVVDLNGIEGIGVEIKLDEKGTRRLRRRYLYLYGNSEKYLMNDTAKVYINPTKLGMAISEVTNIPYLGTSDGDQPVAGLLNRRERRS